MFPILCFLCAPLLCSAQAINLSRVLSELETLASHNDLAPPSVQRVVYTPSDLSARAYLRRLISAANLTIHEDGIGNLFAVWRGSSPSRLRAVATGSHIDAIPHSGMYDGVLGVLGGLEAIRSLQEAGFTPSLDVHLILFTSEEPTRFGIGCLGSRMLSGELSEDSVTKLIDSKGTTVDEARKGAGFKNDLSKVSLSVDSYSAFIELHIEQADSLERSSTQIGAVTSIAAPAQAVIRFSGLGGHAGALPMAERHDPGLAAAELSLEVEKAALEGQSAYAVATTGRFEVFPGAVNSVPRSATLGIDVRNVDLQERNDMLSHIQDTATKIAMTRGVSLEFNITNADAPAECAGHVVKKIIEAAQEAKLSVSRLVSRAYHDALFMARKFPTGMIFVPCRAGVSHRPDEYVEPSDIRNGILVLAKVIANLTASTGLDDVVQDEL